MALVLVALFAPTPARAEPCMFDVQCASGFCVNDVCCDTACKAPCEACSAAVKGGGSDGTCGQAKAGAVCKAPTCDGALDFTGESTCDASGACVAPAPKSCLDNDPCKIDLCADTGCEHITKQDGTECGQGGNGATLVCTSGVCAEGVVTGAGGAGGAGGGAGVGGQSSGGGGGANGGAGGRGGAGDLYPPAADAPTCGCRSTEGAPLGGAGALVIGALALLFRRRTILTSK